YKIGKIVAAAAGGVASAATSIPGLSAIATELYSSILRPPVAKRTDEFWTAIGERLIILEEKVDGFSIESLKDNELFVSVIWQATQKAISNHGQEKLEALQNAVLNTAKGIDIEANMQMVLLRYIDDLTPLHLRTLRLFEKPRGYLHQVGREYPPNVPATSLTHLIEHAIPELHKQQENIRIIYRDLYNYGLVSTSPDSLGVSMTTSPSELFAQRTTDMARVLLRYISAPRELGNNAR
ncbi:MAG: hypothetical protein MN733_28955, partial [Nitrososphaera sp.]|nr:hypothetical protein [Nitrososphaera sp.]